MKIRCAVLGATGVVGQNFLRLLRGHPYFELGAICASDARTGQKLATVRELIPGGLPTEFIDMVFDSMEVSSLHAKDIQIIFSALPSNIAKTIEKEAAEAGIHVFSNASAYRMDSHVPIMIPEINADHFDLTETQKQKSKGYIITNANCTTTGLTMALLPLLPLGIKKLVVSSYQAISGAGYPGHSAMDMATNVVPYIKNEEEKLRKECVKIYGKVNNDTIETVDWQVYGTCVRVPTIVGHLLSVHAEMESKTSVDDVVRLCETSRAPERVTGLPTAPERPVIYTAEPDRPQPRLDVMAGEPERAQGMAVVNGRIQVEENIVKFISLSNNLIRGAAGGSVLNAELAYRENRF